MSDEAHLYPLRFEPVYEYRPWGGRRLADLLAAPLPGNGPIGEAWMLSDRDDHASRVANGPLGGRTLAEVLAAWPEPMLGTLAGRFRRFPLLLKFLDARGLLSVQVHPSDAQADVQPAGETGKTEAWVVLEAGPAELYLRGTEAGHDAGRPAPGDRGRDGRGPVRRLRGGRAGPAAPGRRR